MTLRAQVPLAEQRRALRERMLAQRELIAARLGPAQDDGDTYPRSRTMRFLRKRPARLLALLAGLAALLAGARNAKFIAAVAAMTRFLRSDPTRH